MPAANLNILIQHKFSELQQRVIIIPHRIESKVILIITGINSVLINFQQQRHLRDSQHGQLNDLDQLLRMFLLHPASKPCSSNHL
jgi:hypothetical protein